VSEANIIAWQTSFVSSGAPPVRNTKVLSMMAEQLPTPACIILLMFHYLYILQSQKDKKFYTGITSDLRKRVKEHNSGKNISTSYRRPFKLIYYEAYLFKKDAEAREKYLKTSMGKRVIKKQLANFLVRVDFGRSDE